MKQVKYFSILILITILFCSQGYTQLIPYNKKGKWGFATKEGKVTIPCIYEAVEFFSDDNLAKVKLAGNFGYINSKAEYIIPFEYDSCVRIYEVYHVENGVGIKNNPLLHIEDQFDYDDVKNNRYIVSKNKNFGILEILEGKPNMILPIEYSKIQFDINKKVFHCTKNGATAYFDMKGILLTPEKVGAIKRIEYSSVMAPGIEDTKYFVVKNENGKKGVVEKSDRYSYGNKYDTILSAIYEDILVDEKFIYNNSFAVKKKGKWGMMEGRNITLPIIYDGINYDVCRNTRDWAPYKRLYVVKKNKKWGILGKKLETGVALTTLLPFEYDNYQNIYYSYIALKKSNKFFIYNIDTYKFVSTKSYTAVSKYENESFYDFYLFQVKNKLGQTVFVGKNGVEFFEN
jgi:hypothetical protein